MAAGETEHKVQPGAHAGNFHTFTTTCKHCSHCRKDYHNDSECIALHPYLKKKGENGGRSGGNTGGRGGKGGRGGNNNNNNNNPPKDEPKPADAEAAAAFSFMPYAEQPASAATCLITNSQSLESRTSQLKTIAQTSSVFIAAALLAL